MTGHARRVTDVLMITTTMGMLHGVHGHTADARPAVALRLVLVVCTTSLHYWLVNTTATGDDADHGTAVGGQDLLCARGELDTGDTLVVVVSYDGGIVARGASKGTTVTGLFLDVAYNGTLGEGLQRQDVAHGQGCLGSTIHKLSRVHALGSDESGNVAAKLVGILEFHLGQGSTTTRVMDDLTDDTANVAITLGIVENA